MTFCKSKLKKESGNITNFIPDTMRVVVEGYEKMFLTENAQPPVGTVIEKKLVEIIFFGDKAHIVWFILYMGCIIDTRINKSKLFMGKPAPKNQMKNTKEFVEMMRVKKYLIIPILKICQI